MESQKDRFIRKFMYMVGTRKERILEMQSIERQQRQMPQGQIDLGIYPGLEENDQIRYGFVEPLTLVEDSVYEAYENVDSLDLRNSDLEAHAPNLTIFNCAVDVISSDQYPTNFEYCTFYGGTRRHMDCTFYRCDFTPWIEFLLNYITMGVADGPGLESYIRSSIFTNGNILTECSINEEKIFPDNWETIWAPET